MDFNGFFGRIHMKVIVTPGLLDYIFRPLLPGKGVCPLSSLKFSALSQKCLNNLII